MLNLIIIDDETYIRQGIAKVVEDSGRNVSILGSFSNGLLAYEDILKRPMNEVDLIITDIMMPKMDGLKLIGKLKVERPLISFVLISGFNDFDYARQGLKYGVMDYLMKPLNFDEIVQILDRFDKSSLDIDRGTPSPTPQSRDISTASIERKGNRIIEQVKAIINRNYQRNISLQELADEVFITLYYLSKLFRKETGMTVTDYIIQVRMAKAKLLLEYHLDYKIYEISERVGYPDAAYFIKLFKKIEGLTPKEYKDWHKSKTSE